MAKKTYYTAKEFCENSNWSEATQKNYYYALLNYARFLFPESKDPVADLNKRVRSTADPAKAISAYVNHMKGSPPKTVSLYLTAVRSFYGINGHVFNKQVMKRVVPPTGSAETKQGILTTQMLKRILTVTDARSRVMVLLMASTGGRIGELCAVQLEDLDRTKDPWRICLKKEYTKNGKARYVFVTDECQTALETWLDMGEREKYLNASYQRNEGLNDKFKDQNRLPPDQDHRLLGVSTAGFREVWYGLLKRSMKKEDLTPDKKTRVHPFSPHVIRKWFRTTLNTAINNTDVCNLILGHWDHSLDAVYARVGPDGLAAEFKKGQYAISIQSGEAVKEVQEKVDRQTDRVISLERQLELQREENLKMQRWLESKNREFESQMNEFGAEITRIIKIAKTQGVDLSDA